MFYFIQDFDDTQIFIADQWGREYYITKFNINKDFPIEDDEVLIQWSDFEKGDGGQKRELRIRYEDVVDGYGGYLSNPTSAADLRATLLQYYDSGFTGGGGGNILVNKGDLLSHDGAGDTIFPIGANESILSVNTAQPTSHEYITKAAVVTGGLTGGGSSIISANLTTSRALVSDVSGKVAVAATTSAELGFVSGVTSAIQTQLNAKYATLFAQFSTVNPSNNTTRYFGNHPRTIQGSADQSKIFIRAAGSIKIADFYTFANGTAGSNENISLYIRLNNTTDTLIQTVGLATAERIFTNSALSITVADGDYIELKFVFPTWATPPTQLTGAGNLYILT